MAESRALMMENANQAGYNRLLEDRSRLESVAASMRESMKQVEGELARKNAEVANYWSVSSGDPLDTLVEGLTLSGDDNSSHTDGEGSPSMRDLLDTGATPRVPQPTGTRAATSPEVQTSDVVSTTSNTTRESAEPSGNFQSVDIRSSRSGDTQVREEVNVILGQLAGSLKAMTGLESYILAQEGLEKLALISVVKQNSVWGVRARTDLLFGVVRACLQQRQVKRAKDAWAKVGRSGSQREDQTFTREYLRVSLNSGLFSLILTYLFLGEDKGVGGRLHWSHQHPPVSPTVPPWHLPRRHDEAKQELDDCYQGEGCAEVPSQAEPQLGRSLTVPTTDDG